MSASAPELGKRYLEDFAELAILKLEGRESLEHYREAMRYSYE